MPPKGIVPGHHPDIRAYLKKKECDYRTRRRLMYSNPELYDFPPYHWSSEFCMLVRLPTELVFMVIEHLYQADLYHLAATCRRMAECTISTLYTRDITTFGCVALRWSCTFGIMPTLERTLWYGAPVDCTFHKDSAAGCDWVIATGWQDYFSPLVTAVAADEPHAVRALCAHGADVNAVPVNWNPSNFRGGNDLWIYPIHFAMGRPHFPIRRPGFRQGNPDIVRFLLDAGADPNQGRCDRPPFQGRGNNFTPLFLAMQSKVPVETVRLLLERGADPAVDLGVSHQSPLEMFLVRKRPSPDWPWRLDWEKLTLLLTYLTYGGAWQYGGGALLYYRQQYPLLYSYFDSPEIVRLTQLFVSNGANLAEWGPRSGISPIQAVIWWAEVRCAVLGGKGIGEIPNIIGKMCDLITIMAEATLGGVEPKSQSNLAARRSTIIDIPVTMTSHAASDGYAIITHEPTPLSYVCSPFRFPGGTALIDILLQFGANINATSNGGVTVLHHAVMFNTGVAVRLLVESSGGPIFSGLNVNAPDCRGWTPLHYACHFGFSRKQRNQADAVRVLLDHGANIHARTTSGITPLLLAVWCSNVPVVEVLLDRGAGKDDMSIQPSVFTAKNPYNPLVDHPSIIFEDTPEAWRGDEEHITSNILKTRYLFLNLHQRNELEFIDNGDAPEKIPMDNLHSTASIYAPCFFEIKDTTNDRFCDINADTTCVHHTDHQKLKFAAFDLKVYVIDTDSHNPRYFSAHSID